MRWNEILMESIKKYMPMFEGMIALYPTEQERKALRTMATGMIRATESEMVREDRVIWVLRWKRFYSLCDSIESRFFDPDRLGVDGPQHAAEALLNRYAAELGMSVDMCKKAYELYFQTTPKWKHFASHPAAKLQAVVWKRQAPHELNNELIAIEQEWQKHATEVLPHRDEEIFLDMGATPGWAGWAWYDLETPSCDAEAKAMGHCGNAGGHYGDTILSLRRKVEGGVRPSLTFILDGDGMLGEMKGRENNKPSEKYHPAIVALLKDERVRGIKGGGYQPENNFEMADLPEPIKKELQAANPFLRDLNELYDYFQEHREQWLKDNNSDLYNLIADRLREGIESDVDSRYDRVNPKVNLEAGTMTIWSYRNLDDYLDMNHSFLGRLNDAFEETLPKALSQHKLASGLDMGWVRSQNIAQAAKARLFPEMTAELLPIDQDYKVEGTENRFDPDTGKIFIDCPLDQYFHLFWGEDSHSNRQWIREGLDEVNEGWEADRINYLAEIEGSDPVTEVKREFYKYLMSLARAMDRSGTYGTVVLPPLEVSLVEAVMTAFADSANTSFTTRDRNQHEFNFDK